HSRGCAGPVGDDEPDVEPVGDAGLHARSRRAGPESARRDDLLCLGGCRAHGHSGSDSSPSVSGKPRIAFRFWTADPAAPFTRLSRTPNTTSRRFASSTIG